MRLHRCAPTCYGTTHRWCVESCTDWCVIFILATILAEEGRAKEAEELFREGLSMYAILAQAHPEREDFRLGEEAFRESLAQLSAGV